MLKCSIFQLQISSGPISISTEPKIKHHCVKGVKVSSNEPDFSSRLTLKKVKIYGCTVEKRDFLNHWEIRVDIYLETCIVMEDFKKKYRCTGTYWWWLQFGTEVKFLLEFACNSKRGLGVNWV